MSNSQPESLNQSKANTADQEKNLPKNKWRKIFLSAAMIIAVLTAVFNIGRNLQTLKDLKTRVGEIESQIGYIRQLIEGPNGLRKEVALLKKPVEDLVEASTKLDCKISTIHIERWFRDFEVRMWQCQIDKLTTPGFSMFKELCNQINGFSVNLQGCERGMKLINQLVALRDGFKAYNSRDYEKAYDLFLKLDLNRSITNRFLGTAKGKQADIDSDPNTRSLANQHLRDAYKLLKEEPLTAALQEILQIMHCNKYSTEPPEAKHGIECYKDLASQKVHQSFAYANIASRYAHLGQYKNAMEYLRKFIAMPYKELGKKELSADVDLMKLKKSKYRAEFERILNDPSIESSNRDWMFP